MPDTVSSSETIAAADMSSRVTAVVIAGLLGAFLVFGVGFAHSQLLHNAAHDSRHSLAFPCH